MTATAATIAPTRILGIDPGNEESAYALIRVDSCEPIGIGKVSNHMMRSNLERMLKGGNTLPAIEMIASYGMPVGREVFETCLEIGRLMQITETENPSLETMQIYRREIKLHICHSPNANDATIRQALVDRFAPGERNYGKGTKQYPGWFYDFKADIWQAYAVAVTAADRVAGRL